MDSIALKFHFTLKNAKIKYTYLVKFLFHQLNPVIYRIRFENRTRDYFMQNIRDNIREHFKTVIYIVMLSNQCCQLRVLKKTLFASLTGNQQGLIMKIKHGLLLAINNIFSIGFKTEKKP